MIGVENSGIVDGGEELQQQAQNLVDVDKTRYIRKDVKGGFITNQAEIKYYNQIEQIDVYDNLLLGDFQTSGDYTIDDGIKRELLAVKKYYESAFGNNMFCVSACDVGGFGNLEFSVQFQKDMPKQGYATAKLCVLETIDRANGYYQNTNTAFVASYVAIDGPSFEADALAKFNISAKKEGGLLFTEKSENLQKIIARKNDLLAKKAQIMPHLDKFCKRVVDKKLKALKESKIGEPIIDEFEQERQTVSKYFINSEMAGYSRYLNQMLDGVLDNHSEEILQDIKLKAQINEANSSFVDELNGKREQNAQKIVAEDKIEKQFKEDIKDM